MLSPDSGIYHPDLVAACDGVIGKVGYSTLAEVYQAGVPFGYIRRPRFRESAPLAAFIDREMVSMEITGEQFRDSSWLDRVSELCRCPRDREKRENGSMAAAAFLGDLLASQP
jgi:UDP-N-acetylglucosamine:LPS N-acetylglucosamine transferase